MEISISLPLDHGFLRRACPHCQREFKWYDDSTGEPSTVPSPPPPFYHCPYCGEPAGPDDWWTEGQLDYATAMAAGPAMRVASEELEALAKGTGGGLFEMTVKTDGPPAPPSPLVELSDMTEIASPCHPSEPVKVDESYGNNYHCLVCGERFSV